MGRRAAGPGDAVGCWSETCGSRRAPVASTRANQELTTGGMNAAGELEASNYRCLKDVEIRFDGRSLLIGGNGAGKTSVLEAIDKVFGAGRRGFSFTEEDLAADTDEIDSRVRDPA